MSGIRIPGSVVVITGASSGIGQAAAIAFARQGANLVIGARRAELLRDVAKACHKAARRAGYRRAKTIAVPVDVAQADDAANLAQVALKRFGRIDVWINNAGVGAVGAFTDVPIAAHDRVVQTNLLGTMHGAHAAMPVFLRQGRGILINTLSVGAFVPAPFATAYSASKFGLRGFTQALRAEFQPSPHIHICDVFPSFVDTPGIQHGANYTGRFLQPAPPVIAVQRVADTMVSLARSPRDTTMLGAAASMARFGYAVLPGLSRWLMRQFIEKYLDRAPRIANGIANDPGNLFSPVPQGRSASGGWRRPRGGLFAAGIAGTVGLIFATAAAGWIGLQDKES